MDSNFAPIQATMLAVDEFTLALADDRGTTYDTLLYRGRRVAEVEARVIEAQFRLFNDATLLLLNDDQPFKETLTILLVSPALKVLDRMQLGGAFTPGYMTAVYPTGPDEVAFCWHDLDQIVTIRHQPRLFGRPRWLSVREQPVDLPSHHRGLWPDLMVLLTPAAGQARRIVARRHRSVLAMVWLAWLSVRTWRFRDAGKRARARTR